MFGLRSKHNVKSICTPRTLPPMTVLSCPANTKSRTFKFKTQLIIYAKAKQALTQVKLGC